MRANDSETGSENPTFQRLRTAVADANEAAEATVQMLFETRGHLGHTTTDLGEAIVRQMQASKALVEVIESYWLGTPGE